LELFVVNCACKNGVYMAEENTLQGRRGFLAKLTVLLAAALALVTPAVVGVAAFLNPLRQKSQAGGFIRVANFEAVPEDGTPQKFSIIANRTDAWNVFPNEPVGAIYLRRAGKDGVEAMQVICPHAGCSIGLKALSDKKTPGDKKTPDPFIFYCPCHAASFDMSGKRLDAVSPSPRDMDSLEVEIRNKNEVWVKFQKFITGTTNKIAQS
jgi:menaquinol-cytochrome c reductase iron-sulfur subunit